jgi:NTE family protein
MKKLALVLGGGACKGFAHIGVIKVLEENGIKPNLIVGTSMGAIIGGVYASGKLPDYIIAISKKLTRKQLMDFNPLNVFWATGMLNGKKLKKVLKDEIGEIRHDQLKIPFVAVAVDLLQGCVALQQEGCVVDSMLASSAIPGVFPVVQRGNQILCDGGMLNNVPDDVAKDLAKDYIILSIDVIGDYAKQVEKPKIKAMGVMINALTLAQTKIMQMKGNCSDMRIEICQHDVSLISFDAESIEKSIQYGLDAMQKNVKKLKKILED